MALIGTQLHRLASEHRDWLAARQAIVASNVANANTPGYRALQPAPFEASLASAALEPETTQAGHLSTLRPGERHVASQAGMTDGGDRGTAVDLVQEMLAAADIHKGFALNAQVTKSFNRMLQITLRG